MTIKGEVKNILYENNDTNYKVVQIKTKEKEETIVGVFVNLEEGLNYEFSGEYVTHNRYGKQFKVSSYKKDIDTKSGLITYLSSAKFVGIGPKLATKIVEALGDNAINLIASDINNLNGIPGVSQAKKELIYAVIKNSTEEDKIYLELYNYGLTNQMARKLIEQYGYNVLNVISENPYRLIYDCDGFGFKRSDQLALKLGFKEDNEIRIREAILYTLENMCYQSGYTYVYFNDLANEANDFLKLDVSLIEKQIINLINSYKIKAKDDRIYLKRLYDAEFYSALNLKRILEANYNKFSNDKILTLLAELERNLNIKYSDSQKETILNVLNDKVAIITGGPGTGKTTIVKAIINIYKGLGNHESDILLVAPTGRAAKRLEESCLTPASTIHRALGYDYRGQYAFDKFNLLPHKLVIIDESSMIDIELAYKLLQAINQRARVIFIGDVNQLPSVGPGEFLHDLIESNRIKTYHLKEIMRQVADSHIVKLANQILNKNIYFKDYQINKKEVLFYDLTTTNLKGRLKWIIDNYLEKGNDLHNLQILIPIYNGENGIYEINNYIQELYNHNKDKSLKHGNITYLLNDRVLQLQNEPEKGVMNGDVGYIYRVNEDNLDIMFNNKSINYQKSDLDNLTLAYATSVHKAQGSEYDYVILPILSSYHIMLKRKLIYTAVTRAKKKLIILGDTNYLNSRIKYNEQIRNTYLAQLLKDPTFSERSY